MSWFEEPEKSVILRLYSYFRLKSKISVKYPVYASRNLKLSVGDHTRIHEHCIIKGNVQLGDDVRIGHHSVIKGNVKIESSLPEYTEVIGNVKIGKYCAISSYVIFQDEGHSMEYPCMQIKLYKDITEKDMERTSKGIEVGNDVWIGKRSTILSGVKIGHGAVIGAGSIVTKNVKPYEIVAGNPAKHIRYRFSKKIREFLLKEKWWDWNYYTILKNKEFFELNLNKAKTIPIWGGFYGRKK